MSSTATSKPAAPPTAPATTSSDTKPKAKSTTPAATVTTAPAVTVTTAPAVTVTTAPAVTVTTAPAVTPAVTTPAVTTPAVTTAPALTTKVTTPAVTTPAVTTKVTTPAVITPAVTTPAVTNKVTTPKTVTFVESAVAVAVAPAPAVAPALLDTSDEADTVQWDANIDRLLAGWCDQAKCYEWMHCESFASFDSKAKGLMLTINILVAISGLSNVIAGGIIVSGFQISWIFGSFTILTSMANMMQDKLAWQQSSEVHKRLNATWGVIRRKLEEELILPPASRKDCTTFLRYIRADINNVSADSDSKIPKWVRDACYSKFRTVPNFDIPDICGQVEHTRVYVPLPSE
jgi:hypothetical protein